MIYLIGGPPRSGKTTMAELLSKRLHIPWIPIDYLEAVVSQYVPNSVQDTSYPLTHARQTPQKNNDLFYKDFSADQIIAFYRDKAKKVWPGLRALIEYAAYEHRSFILEGLHIDPACLSDLPDSIRSTVQCIFLYRVDSKGIEEGFQKSTEKHDWVLEHTKEPETFSKIADMISRYGIIIRDEAKKCDYQAVCMDEDFDTQMQKVIKSLSE